MVLFRQQRLKSRSYKKVPCLLETRLRSRACMEYKGRRRLLGLWIRISRENGRGEVETGLLFTVQVMVEMVPKISYQKRGINLSNTGRMWLCCMCMYSIDLASPSDDELRGRWTSVRRMMPMLCTVGHCHISSFCFIVLLVCRGVIFPSSAWLNIVLPFFQCLALCVLV